MRVAGVCQFIQRTPLARVGAIRAAQARETEWSGKKSHEVVAVGQRKQAPHSILRNRQ